MRNLGIGGEREGREFGIYGQAGWADFLDWRARGAGELFRSSVGVLGGAGEIWGLVRRSTVCNWRAGRAVGILRLPGVWVGKVFKIVAGTGAILGLAGRANFVETGRVEREGRIFVISGRGGRDLWIGEWGRRDYGSAGGTGEILGFTGGRAGRAFQVCGQGG